ncbi:hypothetical protein RB653_002783 [Dictyostelium firmibasis]|uniref:Saposin B-type domain-containing protein n=1 Tax=Dictyostelium firmibasis TaxID=79012 RepID=A0AAN7YYZ1_9MYCE
MNKIISLFLIAILLISTVFSSSTKECELCTNLMFDSLNELIEIAINGGVIGSCAELCNKLGIAPLCMVCGIACDAVGINVFMDLLDDAFPDPLYICESVKMCEYNDNATSSISDLQINPMSGNVGDTFKIGVSYNVTNTIATGEISWNVIDPKGFQFGEFEVIIDQTPSTYSAVFNFQATPSEQEEFPSGEYQLQMQICEGSCGSPHAHSYILSTQYLNFTII